MSLISNPSAPASVLHHAASAMAVSLPPHPSEEELATFHRF